MSYHLKGVDKMRTQIKASYMLIKINDKPFIVKPYEALSGFDFADGTRLMPEHLQDRIVDIADRLISKEDCYNYYKLPHAIFDLQNHLEGMPENMIRAGLDIFSGSLMVNAIDID